VARKYWFNRSGRTAREDALVLFVWAASQFNYKALRYNFLRGKEMLNHGKCGPLFQPRE
jgi:hypothetical protein